MEIPPRRESGSVDSLRHPYVTNAPMMPNTIANRTTPKAALAPTNQYATTQMAAKIAADVAMRRNQFLRDTSDMALAARPGLTWW